MGREYVYSYLSYSLFVDDMHLVPVYDARALCMNEVSIDSLHSYQSHKGDLERLGNVDIEAGSFVGVVHCAKWIPSMKHVGKDRVYLSIAEVYLLADPEVSE